VLVTIVAAAFAGHHVKMIVNVLAARKVVTSKVGCRSQRIIDFDDREFVGLGEHESSMRLPCGQLIGTKVPISRDLCPYL
jgi:hypothetical protein